MIVKKNDILMKYNPRPVSFQGEFDDSMVPENSQILAKSGKIETKSQNDQKILKNPSQGQYVGSRHPECMILTSS